MEKHNEKKQNKAEQRRESSHTPVDKSETFGLYLRKKREEKGLTLNQLAETSGVSGAQISRLENGHRGVPKPLTILKLSAALHIPYDEMMIEAGYFVFIDGDDIDNIDAEKIEERVRLEELSDAITEAISGLKDEHSFNLEPSMISDIIEGKINPSSLVAVPFLAEIKAGYELYDDEQVLHWELVSKDTISDGEYFFLIVKGDSMSGDRIQEGDRVLVKRQNFVDEGKIAVVLVDEEEGTLKRVFPQEDGTIILQSSNPNHPPRVHPESDVYILGQVVKVEFDI